MTSEWPCPLRAAVDRERDRLQAAVPANREAAIRALIRRRDGLPDSHIEPVPDPIAGRRLADPGGNLALGLCLEATGDASTPGPPGDDLDPWAERFATACDRLSEAGLVLRQVESGVMRIVESDDGTFDAWLASRRTPAAWRERAGIDWWAAWLARRYAPASAIDASADDSDPARLAEPHLEAMAWQLPYGPDAVLGGLPVRTWRAILAWLIGHVLSARDCGKAAPVRSAGAMISDLAADLALDPARAGRALDAFTLDVDNAAGHSAVPGVAAAPIVRTGPAASGRLVLSLRGLTSQPLLFLTRELRRRDPADYHNAAHLREGTFRQDLYALFADRRFVTSDAPIRIRRERGDLRTDVDAAIFDRKTGALALFELKSPDPFARSPAELTRQRDNVLSANHQIGGILAWLQRHGADEILNRIDRQTAKRFRVRKVFPFVLGRTLARFDDGPEPDRRAAWATWPEVLRLTGGEPFRGADANPIASLHARLLRLAREESALALPGDGPSRELAIGDARLVVHPSYAAFRTSTRHGGDDR